MRWWISSQDASVEGARKRTGSSVVFAALLSAVILSLSLITVQTAAAKPKQTTVNGCTAEQIQAPSAGPCVNQLEQDTANGVAYPHQLMCDETGVYCCQSDGTRTFGCKKVAAFRPPNFSPVFKTPGQLQVAPGQ